MWAGTNNGSVYIFTISIPPNDKRKERRVTAQLGKEVQLKHRAPVIGITVIDAENRSVTEVQENSTPGKPLDICGPHKVIIASEEQFKVIFIFFKQIKLKYCLICLIYCFRYFPCLI